MKKIAFGLAVALLSTVAYAQTSQAPTTGAGSTSSSSSDSTAPMQRIPTGSRTQTETTGAVQSRSVGAQGTDMSARTRIEGGTRIEGRDRVGVGVGVSNREEGVSVRRRTVREYDEPGVSVTRRRTVTSYEEPSTEVHRTVIKKAKPSVKKVVVRKKKPTSRVVVRSHRHYVVDEPVEVRRRTVRRYEVDEPSVSVRHHTTIRQSQDVRPSVGISVEQRRSSVRQSNDTGVSVTRERSMSNPETTGAISNRTQTNTNGGATGVSSRARTGTSGSGGSAGASGSAPAIRLQQGGSSSGGSANQ